ncbi:MAG: 2-amino-4-hydroxy-6-hydroxymethyldihydropteridine diphosphokinase [Gammaproteobacteria bacterium]|nr:2-amino-4-hydroxy-6-hydroxymethyldihydropteridine diphosphokinase [Gammaproteobacteria bacterium]
MARVYISIGSNIDRQANIRSALAALRESFGQLTVSPVYESKAVGFAGDDFYNLAVGFDSTLDPLAINHILRDIEHHHGRVRGGSGWTSRTLDLDLLLYGDLISGSHGLTLPRGEITKYAFVLCPLAEIAGEERHPVSGMRYSDLWAAFDKAAQPLWRVDFAG